MTNDSAPTLYDLAETANRRLDRLINMQQDEASEIRRLKRKLTLLAKTLVTAREMLDGTVEMLQRIDGWYPDNNMHPFIDRLSTHYKSFNQVCSECDLTAE